MKPLDYLLDRLPLLLAFTISLIFLLLVVHLAVAPLNVADAAYLLLLALVSTSLILGVDYSRHRSFRQQIKERLAESSAAPLVNPASREQRAVAELLTRSTARHGAELGELRQQMEQHRTFLDQWIHNMKTPVAVIQLTAQQNEGQAWDSIAEETDRLEQGLNIMLGIARLERFEFDLHVVRTDLNALARECVNELRSSWLLAGMYPRITGTPEAFAETDPKWLKVVIRQSLVNAIKYGAHGQHVTVNVTGTELSITDEGPGIPPEELPRVFDRFYTGASNRSRAASTGMGLHLAAQVCDLLNHTIAITSTVGEGTTVTVGFTAAGLHHFGDSAARLRTGK